jgi:hypothetical protein
MKFRWTESLGLLTACQLAAGGWRRGQSGGAIPSHHCGSIRLPSRTRSVLNDRVQKMLGKRSLRAVKTCKCAVAKKMRPSRGGCRNGRNS